MDMLISLSVVTMYMAIKSSHLSLKYVQFLFGKYISIMLEKTKLKEKEKKPPHFLRVKIYILFRKFFRVE